MRNSFTIDTYPYMNIIFLVSAGNSKSTRTGKITNILSTESKRILNTIMHIYRGNSGKFVLTMALLYVLEEKRSCEIDKLIWRNVNQMDYFSYFIPA